MFPVFHEWQSLYTPTDKASLMHAVEEAKPRNASSDGTGDENITKVLIVDAMAVLQSMKKTPAMKKLCDLKDAFIKRINWMMNG